MLNAIPHKVFGRAFWGCPKTASHILCVVLFISCCIGATMLIIRKN